MANELVEHYRRLVGALLEHTLLDHEGTELAIGDFIESDDRAATLLETIVKLQERDRDEARAP